MLLQYHKDRVTHRDKTLVSTAMQLALPGYKAGPFGQSKVERFLQDFSEHRTKAKHEAEAEKVSWGLTRGRVIGRVPAVAPRC